MWALKAHGLHGLQPWHQGQVTLFEGRPAPFSIIEVFERLEVPLKKFFQVSQHLHELTLVLLWLLAIPFKLGLALLNHPGCVWQLKLSAGVVPLLSLLLFLDAAQFGLLGSLVEVVATADHLLLRSEPVHYLHLHFER